jgi:hypothetical protein
MKPALVLSAGLGWIIFAAIFFQQPATQTAPPFGVNAQWVNGVAPGYAPTAGSGLTLNLSAGTGNCAGTIATYSAGTLTMTASTTNYVYLNTASSCVPAVKTTTFTSSDIPLAVVTTGSSTITAITDDRTMFVSPNSSSSGMVWPTFTGLARYSGSSSWTTPTYSDVVSLFAGGSCSGYLKSGGGCDSGTGGSTSAAQFQITGSGSAPSGAGTTFNWNYAGDNETDFINNYGPTSPPGNAAAYYFYSNINGVASNRLAELKGNGSEPGGSSGTTVTWNLMQPSSAGSFSMNIYDDAGNPVEYFNVSGFDPLWFAAASPGLMTLHPNTVLGWSTSGTVGNSPSACFSGVSTSVIGVGNCSVGDTSATIEAGNVVTKAFTQQSASNTGGSCTMSSATSCTLSIAHTYTTPICMATAQGTTPIYGVCSVSGTTVTVTAASSNSATWGIFVFGNPS